jgi:hypothetical protein
MYVLGIFAAVALAIIVLGIIVLGLGSTRDAARYLRIRKM